MRARTTRLASSSRRSWPPIRARSTPASSSRSFTAAPSATTRPSGSSRRPSTSSPSGPSSSSTWAPRTSAAQQYDRSLAALQEGLCLDDNNKDLVFQTGVVYEKQGRFDDAVRTFRRVLVLDPKHAESYNYIGYMYAEQGHNLTEAVRAHQERARPRAGERLLHRQPGLGLLPAGQVPRGAPRAAARGEPRQGRPGPLDHLGDAYIKNGMTGDAITGVGARRSRRTPRRPDRRGRPEEAQRGARQASAGPRVARPKAEQK